MVEVHSNQQQYIWKQFKSNDQSLCVPSDPSHSYKKPSIKAYHKKHIFNARFYLLLSIVISIYTNYIFFKYKEY